MPSARRCAASSASTSRPRSDAAARHGSWPNSSFSQRALADAVAADDAQHLARAHRAEMPRTTATSP
jgi:hypothetical protein